MNDRAMPGDRIRAVTSETFRALVLNGQGPIVVEFMSYACAHCGAIEPVLQRVAGILESQVQIVRVNIGIEHELADDYEISGTPTLIMFLNGMEVGRVGGPSPILSDILADITQAFEQ
jgi:thioredoxin-like negative regulator of GroEL